MTAETLPRPDPFQWRSRPRAPMPGTRLCALDDLADGSAREFIFGRGTTVFSMFAVRRGDRYFGYVNHCPHFSQPLNYRKGQFLNEAGTRIRCTMHFAEFRIEDGYGVKGAAERCWLDPVPLVVRDAEVFIATPEELAAEHPA